MLVERRLVCSRGHSFDLAKSGYVNLTRGRKHAPAAGGDTRAQLEHRTRLLTRGYFDAIADEIADHAPAGGAILEAGCGTGFHLARVAQRLAPRLAAGLDLSKEAVAWCARRYPEFGLAVADVWSPWPVHDQSVGLVASIFAPRNFAEMARVLRPEGWLAMVFQGPGHLQELRAFGLLSTAADKADRYRARLARDFGAPLQRRIVQDVALERDAIADAILMGPSARHLPEFNSRRLPGRMAVTIDLVLLFARRR